MLNTLSVLQAAVEATGAPRGGDWLQRQAQTLESEQKRNAMENFGMQVMLHGHASWIQHAAVHIMATTRSLGWMGHDLLAMPCGRSRRVSP